MKNQLKTILLLGALSALLVAIGARLGPNAFWLFTALAVVMNLVSYFFSDRIVLRMHRARELPEGEAPRLHADRRGARRARRASRSRACSSSTTRTRTRSRPGGTRRTRSSR